MNENSFLTYEEIINRGKPCGLDITWRKLNYYKTLGLLPYSIRKRIKKRDKTTTDKKAYYPSEVFQDLVIYSFLQNQLGLTLDEIKDLKTNLKISGKDKSFNHYISSTYSYLLRLLLKKFQGELDREPIICIQVLNSIFKKRLQKELAYRK